MEQEKTNPVLGYRTAGSLAERKTGDMLLEEMKKAGLTQVEKDKIRVDAWKFKKAVMRCHDREGTCREIQLGAYQTDFKTNGFQRFDLVYLGKGTADEYKDIDVKGKLVLIEINQREEWWINYPVYQAHLKGAAALIAVQSRGYAQIDDTALNAQDIAGPSCAPAFSMSRADFLMIRQLMEEKNENGNRVPELSVEFDADTEVIKDQYTYNIVGKIPGTDSDSMILLSAHYDSYFEDTMRAGHYENRKESVDLMIRGSRAIIDDLLSLGVRFAKNPDGTLAYTREGAHSRPRICFHEDITGKEITTTLLSHVKKLTNVTIMEYTVMTDILVVNDHCCGMIAKTRDGETLHIHAQDTVMATGGIGGLYEHSTNFPILTGDACRIAEQHGVELEHMDYVQIHPTCLYSKKPGRSFLISESARGEGAILLNHKGERFVNELLPRDVVTKAIRGRRSSRDISHIFMRNVWKRAMTS